MSTNIPVERRKEISQCLGVKEVEKHDKYLGLPTLGRSKRQVFVGIVERVSQKLKEWKEKSLSQAGNEVILKAVIQAFPSYAIEIEKEVARFFWGSTLEDNKCHWANWSKLTMAKTNGGVGFWELHYFNLAMLGKQLWGLMRDPNTLSARILHSNYFPRGDILNVGFDFKPSYLWRRLLSARDLVEKGRAWIVGNGKSISISNERRIGMDRLSTPGSAISEEWMDKKVESIIEVDTGLWNQLL